MLEYARWKYILVAAVLLLATLFALPNVFGEDPALQVARKDHNPVTLEASQTVETFLRQRGIHFDRSYIDGGRLMVRFANVADQLAARDAVNDQLKDTYITALSFAPRTPAALRALGLRPMPLGLDLRGGLYLLYQVDVNAAVSQALEGYAQDARRALAAANIPVKDVITVALGSDRPNAVRLLLPPEADVNAARNALNQPLAGLSVSTESLASGSAITGVMTPAQIRERQDYAIQQNITTLRNRVERARRVRADRAAPGNRPHQRAAAGRAELGRSEGHSRPGGRPSSSVSRTCRTTPSRRCSWDGRRSAPSSTATRASVAGAAEARGDCHR